jgi:non-ribosomal peptide synthetase component E (peptide arylation enzyme)/thioesterase domain-containing protein
LAVAHAVGSGCRAVLEVPAIAEDASTRAPGLPLSADALAYVFFTSGSTGRPKGVVDCHRNVLHNIMRYTNNLRIGADDRLSLLQSASFSGTVSSLFGALLNGAAVLPYDLRKGGLGPPLASWLQEERVTIYHSVPSIFRSCLASDGSFPDVRIVRLEGDTATAHDVELHRRHFPTSVLAIGLGATETGLSCQLLLDAESPSFDGVVPIGFPTADVRLTVRDPTGQSLPPGHIGELAVTSPYLAVGYWKRPDLTATTFTPAAEGGSCRTYASGDLARTRPDGCVEFLGRKDHRLKIAGHTVEAGDVETTLLRTGLVREAIVITHEDSTGESCLVAYVVPSVPEAWSERDVRALMAQWVPEHMVPRTFVLQSQLPVTETGKVDRSALGPPPRQPGGRRAHRPPRDDLEKTLAEVWAAALGLPDVGVDEDFRDLGGTSLRAGAVSSALARRLGRKIPANAIAAHGTVQVLARALRRGLGLPPGAARMPLQSSGSRTPLFFVSGPVWGPPQFAPLGTELGPDRPLHALWPLDETDFATDDLRFESLARRRIGDLLAVQARGPYLLGGWCYGAVVAFEMARQLRARGETVALLALCHITAFDFPSLVSPRARLRYRAHEALRDGVDVMARLARHGRKLFEDPARRLPRLARTIRRVPVRARELRSRATAPTETEKRAFEAYVPRPYSDDVLLVLNESQTRAYTRDPEADWRGLTTGRITVRLLKRGGSGQFDDAEMLEAGAVLRRELELRER